MPDAAEEYCERVFGVLYERGEEMPAGLRCALADIRSYARACRRLGERFSWLGLANEIRRTLARYQFSIPQK